MSDQDGFAHTTRWNVVSRLREEILGGRLPYGTRLRQAEVAERFGISTTPVREAFRELATLGLVEIHPHRGAVVHRPSTNELAQIYEVRVLVEPVCTAWSALLITERGIEQARALLDSMRGAGDPDAGAALNRRFHALIAGACGNDHLSDLVIKLLDLSTPYIVRITERSTDRSARQVAEHEEILRACESRDPARAYHASLDHLTRLHTEPRKAAGLPTAPGRWLPFDLQAWLAENQGPSRHNPLTTPGSPGPFA